MKNRLEIGFGLILTFLITSCQGATPQSSELQKQEHKLWINTNLIRRHQADLPELVRTEEADKLARDASCMFLKGKWDKSESDRKVALGADVSAENYSQDYENTADKAIAIWYRDEKAMKNLLNPVYHKTGVGTCKSEQFVFFTQIYYR
ncbi:MAG: CAP domain-containing protein [Planktothrix sp. GU0601_MAG3]|nr:MAG: CAP domain-containing protein [Planktothrix sp. GU0601_MAG3]